MKVILLHIEMVHIGYINKLILMRVKEKDFDKYPKMCYYSELRGGYYDNTTTFADNIIC